jgi:hypothetical protein
MADEMRRWLRREYLRQHAEARRRALKAAGARRIDVTLDEADLANYDQVRAWLVIMNRLFVERGLDRPRTLPDGRPFAPNPLYRLSDSEIIKAALRLAARAASEAMADQAKLSRAALSSGATSR